MRVLLACDRSGGHVFPALALGKQIGKKDKGYFISLLFHFGGEPETSICSVIQDEASRC